MELDDLQTRPLTTEEIPRAHDLMVLAFGGRFDAEDLDAETSVFEVERSLSTWDGDELVGTMSTYSHEISVPGGALPTAGTTWVAVQSTHRRRGILRRMMSRHLHEIADRGEPLAALWASEPAIYGRFGYGRAIEQLRLDVALDAALRWQPTAPPEADRVRLVPMEQAQAAIAPIYAACRTRRAGVHARPTDAWWRFNALGTRKAVMDGVGRKHVVVAERDGEDVAYAVYGVDGKYVDGRPAGRLVVFEMAGVDPHAEASMWRFLMGQDLVTSLTAPHVPEDTTLPLLLTDSRRVRRLPGDAQHVRVIDVPAALRGRAYRGSAGVTVEVVDDVLERNDGTWRIEVAPEGASVERVEDRAPDLRMPVASLGAMFMGQVRASHLAHAGMVEVHDAGVLHDVDAAFAADEAGWVPEVW